MTNLGRISNCIGGMCVKNALFDNNPLKNPFDSSSGIDLNPYERNEGFESFEGFNNINKRNRQCVNLNSNFNPNLNNNLNSNFFMLALFIIIISYFTYKFSYKKK